MGLLDFLSDTVGGFPQARDQRGCWNGEEWKISGDAGSMPGAFPHAKWEFVDEIPFPELKQFPP